LSQNDRKGRGVEVVGVMAAQGKEAQASSLKFKMSKQLNKMKTFQQLNKFKQA